MGSKEKEYKIVEEENGNIVQLRFDFNTDDKEDEVLAKADTF